MSWRRRTGQRSYGEGVNSFGTVADWLSAIASLGALGVAFAAFGTARRLGRLEVERDHRARDHGRREQATSVTAWMAAEIVDGKATAYGVVLRNSSPNVVYDVTVTTKSKSDAASHPLVLTVVPPGTYWVRSQLETRYKWAFPVDVARIRHEIRPVSKSQQIGVELLVFRDTSDQLWERRANGILGLVAAEA